RKGDQMVTSVDAALKTMLTFHQSPFSFSTLKRSGRLARPRIICEPFGTPAHDQRTPKASFAKPRCKFHSLSGHEGSLWRYSVQSYGVIKISGNFAHLIIWADHSGAKSANPSRAAEAGTWPKCDSAT
ncbi:hypothetical protein BaRGS_00030533, partial [Batillaria attramentaria]